MLQHKDNAASLPSPLLGFSISNRGGWWTQTKEFIVTCLKGYNNNIKFDNHYFLWMSEKK